MGSQQLLLLVLGTIVVAVAIAVGITQFRAYHVEAVGDEMQSTLLTLAAEAKSYYQKPKTLGGGGGTFEGYTIPTSIRNVEGIMYAVPRLGSTAFFIISATTNDGTIQVVMGTTPQGFSIMWMGKGAYADRSAPTAPF